MWLILAFTSACLLGFYDIFKKMSLRDNPVIPVLFLNTLFCSLLFIPLIVVSAYTPWLDETMFHVASGSLADHAHIMLKSLIVLSSWICGYVAIKHLPITIVGPINATRPVMVLVGAMLVYGEHLNLWQWAGVLLAIVSFFLLSRSGRREGINFAQNRWIFFLVLAAVLGAVSGLYDKYLMASRGHGGIDLDELMVQSWFNVYQMVLMGIMLVLLWWPKRKTGTPFRWRWSIPCISLFICMADFAYFLALGHDGSMISMVSMIRRGSVVVSFLFGALIFRERNLRSKAFDMFLVLLGMVCIWIGSH